MNIQICTRCVSDTTMPEIKFDENGVCSFCKLHDRFTELYPLGAEGYKRLDELVLKIKTEGKNKPHDCIIGVSGGRDSTYSLFYAKKILGLRPLAVHFDNGWNSEIAVSNIHKATKILNIDLHTVVADWEEFKDLQRSFLQASVSDADGPTDYAIYSVLYREALKENIKYSINGHSFRAEGSVPKSWSYFDGRYIRSVHKMFGTKRIKSFPIMSLTEFLYYIFVKGIKDIRLMEYIDYRKQDATKVIVKELEWEDYGGHHHESHYTHFFQSYYLPKKFNIDKRKVEYSALVRTGQRTREDVLAEIKNPYPHKEELIEYVLKKLGYTKQEFDNIMKAPLKTFHDYPNYYSVIKACKKPMKLAAQMHFIPKILYEKYAKD